RSGGYFQTFLTVLKVGLVVLLAALALGAPGGHWSTVTETGDFPGWSAFGAMMLAALWAYDGWNNLPMAAGEVREPGKNLPRAIGRDMPAPQRLAALSEGARIPATSVLVQGALSCVLALSGSFDQLTDAVVFASWLFYALNAGSVLRLRMREPDRPRPFRVPGF